MIVLNSLQEFPAELRNTDRFVAVTLGNFDGVHVGHKALFSVMEREAKKHYGIGVAFSFKPHPQEVLTGVGPKKLNTEKDKEQIIHKLGADYLLNFPFNRTVAAQSPEDFVREVLIEGLNAKEVVVGYNYTFGDRGVGTAKILEELCAFYDCHVTVVPQVQTRLGVVSSTLIRRKIAAGDIAAANELLGYNYQLKGKVVKGLQLGRKLGFPTANVRLEEDMQLPEYGVYACYSAFEGRMVKSVVNVGLRPTINNNVEPTVESNLLNFTGNLYGKKMTVFFVEKIRSEEKFDGLDALKRQIAKDAKTAEAILAEKKVVKF